jgi:hypothetical protein
VVRQAKENKQVAFRAGDGLIKRIDTLADAMRDDGGGISPGRSGVVRRLILLSLPILESQHGVERKAS